VWKCSQAFLDNNHYGLVKVHLLGIELFQVRPAEVAAPGGCPFPQIPVMDEPVNVCCSQKEAEGMLLPC